MKSIFYPLHTHPPLSPPPPPHLVLISVLWALLLLLSLAELEIISNKSVIRSQAVHMGQRMSSALLGADCGHIISLAINFHLHRSLGVPTSIHTPSLNGLFGHQIHGLINVRFGELWPLDNTNSAVRSSTCVQCVVYLPGHHLLSTVSVAVPVCEIKRIPVCELRNKLQK